MYNKFQQLARIIITRVFLFSCQNEIKYLCGLKYSDAYFIQNQNFRKLSPQFKRQISNIYADQQDIQCSLNE